VLVYNVYGSISVSHSTIQGYTIVQFKATPKGKGPLRSVLNLTTLELSTKKKVGVKAVQENLVSFDILFYIMISFPFLSKHKSCHFMILVLAQLFFIIYFDKIEKIQ
jgi:hypothetical protein